MCCMRLSMSIVIVNMHSQTQARKPALGDVTKGTDPSFKHLFFHILVLPNQPPIEDLFLQAVNILVPHKWSHCLYSKCISLSFYLFYRTRSHPGHERAVVHRRLLASSGGGGKRSDRAGTPESLPRPSNAGHLWDGPGGEDRRQQRWWAQRMMSFGNVLRKKKKSYNPLSDFSQLHSGCESTVPAKIGIKASCNPITLLYFIFRQKQALLCKKKKKTFATTMLRCWWIAPKGAANNKILSNAEFEGRAKPERRCFCARPRENHSSRDSVLVTALSVCRVTLPDAKQVQLAHTGTPRAAASRGGKSLARSFKKKKK